MGASASVAERAVREAIARVSEAEPFIHAWVEVDADLALTAARRADRTLPRGRLYGLTCGVKDVISVAGMSRRCGSAALAEQVATEDADCVAAIKQAGAIVLGMQVTHELTIGLDEPGTRNPWDLERYPGGSSAGAGASVAVGSVKFALGTDAAGSVRIPAAVTGTVGFKPTWGRFTMVGIDSRASAPSVDHLGIVAGDVACARRVASVLDSTIPAVGEAATPDALAGRRIGVLNPEAMARLDPVGKDVQRAFAGACDALDRVGATLVPVDLPLIERARAAVFAIFNLEVARRNLDLTLDRQGRVHSGVLSFLRLGQVLPYEHYRAALEFREWLRLATRDVYDEFGLEALMTPTMPEVAPRLRDFDPASQLAGLIPFTCPFNLTGQPAISVPCGLSSDGVPIGLQLVGRPFADAQLLDLAAAFEHQAAFTERAPLARELSVGA